MTDYCILLIAAFLTTAAIYTIYTIFHYTRWYVENLTVLQVGILLSVCILVIVLTFIYYLDKHNQGF